MKGLTALAGQAFSLVIAAMMTTSAVAQEKALTLEGQQFLMRRAEQSQARGGGHVPMSHSRACSAAAAPRSASCHAHIVNDETGRPFATPGPSGYSPADLRAAYSVTGNGTSSTIVAIVDAFGYPNAQKDTGCAMRTVADVSAVADPNTGVAVSGPSSRGNMSAWLVFGGTSVAAPLIAGLYGLNDTAVNHGSDPYRHTANLNDVTSGANGQCNVTYLCTAVVGYDGPTGLGTPNGIAAFGF